VALTDPRKILLLAGTAPAPDGVGGIILHDLAGFLPEGSLSVIHVVDAGQMRDTITANGDPMRVLRVSFQRRPNSRWGRLGRAVDWMRMTLANRRNLGKAVRACVEYAKVQHVDEVWAVLDTPTAIALAKPVAQALGLALRVTVWDDIDHSTRCFRLDRFTAARIRKDFTDTVRHATSLAVIGETMQDAYQKSYGSRGVIVRHGAEQPDVDATAIGASGGIRIGFAGSVSARSAFNQLLQALDQLGWRIGGHDVTLVLMGQRFDLWSSVPRRIECMGYRSVDDTIRILSGCNVNYLPQPFEEEWRPFAELSFPSKLTSYLAAGAPVLLHAPPHASLPAFFARYPFGDLCTTLDVDMLAASLSKLCLNEGLRHDAMQAAKHALADEFSIDRFRESFAEFLALEEAEATD
jgi:glycosyltransferase involved in cell wall biosynthesis